MNLIVGVILASALAVGFALQVSDDGRHLLTPGGRAAPDLCLSVVMFGVECPSCGLGRSVVYALDAQAEQSRLAHPGGLVLFGWVVAQLAARVAFAFRRARRAVALADLAQLPLTFLVAVVLILRLGAAR